MHTYTWDAHTGLEGTAPAHERLADLGVYKLNWVGKFERRRLIISEKGELFICASTRGVTKEGIFKKRFSNWFDTMRNIMTFQERYFVLADGTFKYWKDKEDRDKFPGRPQGTINVMDAEITVVRDREEQGYIWFLTEGITGEIHELANETASLRQMWLSAISRNLEDLEQEELLDSIPVMEITALSRLEDDWATLSSFGMLPSQASAAGSAERSGSPERSGPHGSLGSGEKGAHASTAVERLRRHASILGTSKYYLTGGRNDDSFRTPRMAQRLDDQAADQDWPVVCSLTIECVLLLYSLTLECVLLPMSLAGWICGAHRKFATTYSAKVVLFVSCCRWVVSKRWRVDFRPR